MRFSCLVHVTVEYERGSGGTGDAFEAFARFDIFDADVPTTNAAVRSPPR
ncbi:MAG: hypothetical protein KIT84_21475 [Labilithrix sp.]|nr:hypothetical protein [Labilithrix sp.]MCW5813615.1 hypothetical protein [Labilithrix sp.]